MLRVFLNRSFDMHYVRPSIVISNTTYNFTGLRRNDNKVIMNPRRQKRRETPRALTAATAQLTEIFYQHVTFNVETHIDKHIKEARR
jgi:hypothetical protein